VFFNHVGAPTPALYEHAPLVLRWVLAAYRTVVTWGWVGVDLFFTLSAFLITTFLLEERRRFGEVSFRWFFTRRALRIWPLYYLAVSSFCLILPLWGAWAPNIPTGDVPIWAASYFLFLGNMWNALHDRTVGFAGSPLWSVCIEEQFYLVWGLLVSRVGSFAVLGAFVCLAELNANLLRWWLLAHSWSSTSCYFNTLTHLDAIVGGAGLALLGSAVPLNRAGGSLVAAGVVAALALVAYTPGAAMPWQTLLSVPLVAFCCLAFLIGALGWKPLTNLLSTRWLGSVGRLTYALYIVHYAALHLVHARAQPLFLAMPISRFQVEIGILLCKVTLGFALSYLFARLSWRFIEAPCLRQKQRFTRVPTGGIKP
jgi:peptidoglycan/LPS O-acetylase OafA/YrhL